MELVRCTAVFDKEGRFAPAFDATLTKVVEVDESDRYRSGGRSVVCATRLKTERGLLAADRARARLPYRASLPAATSPAAPRPWCKRWPRGKGGLRPSRLTSRASSPQPARPNHVPLIINEAALPASPRAHGPRLPVDQRTLLAEDCGVLSSDLLGSEATRCANCGCVAVSASDLAPALIALRATVKTTQRRLPAETLFTAAESKTTVLEPDELIEAIEIPAQPPGSHQAYYKFRIRNAIDFPIVGLAFCAEMRDGKFHDARVVLGAVAPVPLAARAGRGAPGG